MQHNTRQLIFGAIWDITAFVMELPGMTAQDYASLVPYDAEHSH